MKLLKSLFLYLSQKFSYAISLITLLTIFWSLPIYALTDEISQGEDLFILHCSGCHINGGNIVRRGKTLKLSALKRNGIDNPEEIARIARLGVGSMSGYDKDLGQGDDELIANWIWFQAQNAWTQGKISNEVQIPSFQ